MAVTRVLGIDYGRRRIGLAIADVETRIATPLTTIDGRNDISRDARHVLDTAKQEGATILVVGLPLNMDGTDSEQTLRTRQFAAELERMGGLPLHLQDERLSTFAAHEAMDEAMLRPRQRKGIADRVAAQMILQAYLDRPANDDDRETQ